MTNIIAGCPVVGFTGANGVGKTLAAVSAVCMDLKRGRTVYSTVPIDSPWGQSIPLTSYRQLLEVRDATVLVDEIAVVFSSRDSMTLPREFDAYMQTLRHSKITLRWTAPAWARADVRIREVTQAVVGCHRMGGIVPSGEFWPRPLAILAGCLDTTGIRVDERPEKVMKRRVWIPQRMAGWGCYDTHADTPRLGAPPSGGACLDCGGSTRKEPCSPERHARLGLDAPGIIRPAGPETTGPASGGFVPEADPPEAGTGEAGPVGR